MKMNWDSFGPNSFQTFWNFCIFKRFIFWDAIKYSCGYINLIDLVCIRQLMITCWSLQSEGSLFYCFFLCHQCQELYVNVNMNNGLQIGNDEKSTHCFSTLQYGGSLQTKYLWILGTNELLCSNNILGNIAIQTGCFWHSHAGWEDDNWKEWGPRNICPCSSRKPIL